MCVCVCVCVYVCVCVLCVLCCVCVVCVVCVHACVSVCAHVYVCVRRCVFTCMCVDVVCVAGTCHCDSIYCDSNIPYYFNPMFSPRVHSFSFPIVVFFSSVTILILVCILYGTHEPPKFTKIRYVGKKKFHGKKYLKKKKKKVSLCFTERSCCFTDDSNERSLIRTLVYTCSARFRASYTTFSLRLSSPFRYK